MVILCAILRQKNTAAVRTTKPIIFTLGEMQKLEDARERSGAYESVSEVVRAGLRALEQETAAIKAALRENAMEELNDPSMAIPADQAFAEARPYHAKQVKAGDAGTEVTFHRLSRKKQVDIRAAAPSKLTHIFTHTHSKA